MNRLILYVWSTISMIGCGNNNQIYVQKDIENIPLQSIPVKSNRQIDSLSLDSILYQNKTKILEKKYGRFSNGIEFNKEDKIVSVHSESKIYGHKLKYVVELKLTGDSFIEDEFEWQEEDLYKYQNSSILLDDKKVDLTNVSFANMPSTKVYPAGFWHWSIEGAAAKYYEVSGKKVFLLNGANLFCNGTHCNSYQVYVLVNHGEEVTVSALYFKGLFPYTFDCTHLIDVGNDGVPEIYVPKKNLKEITGINDFDIYSIDMNGLHLK